MTKEQKQLITELAAELKPFVDKIEASLAITQNHYGRYGAALSSLSKGDKRHANFIALALIEAGANPTGVQNGLKLFV